MSQSNEDLAKALGLDFVQINIDPNYEKEMDILWVEMKNNPQLKLFVLRSVKTLVMISSADHDMSEDRQSFLNPKLKDDLTALGTLINETGGFRLIQLIAEVAMPLYAHPSDSRMLEFAWGGIGDWRC